MTAIHLHSWHDRAAVSRRAVALDALADAGQWVFAVLRQWSRRHHERTELAKLDARMLADIGLTPGEADFLANKPFWRE